MQESTLMLFAVLVPLLPVFGFVLTLFAGRKLPHDGALIPIVAIAGSTVLSVVLLVAIYPTGMALHYSWHWFSFVNIGVLVDPLSVAMICMVSFVSLLIHIYAVGYMKGDPGGARYFAETSLFTAGMLGVALADNLFLFFLCWELVGLCSYLLIGFWYRKPSAASAATKAFLVTRVGDMLFLAGIFVLYANMVNVAPQSPYPLALTEVFRYVSAIPPDQLTLIALLFFGGAVGKSGQFPLHIWLPDAMEGPTTVSALIHAATMVTAGVYLVARTFPLFIAAPHALTVVAYVGAFTAFFAATMGLVMNDIKRVLAYSTISQLGYMMLALGAGAVVGVVAVGIALFHLISHAFFKALLFLCAGSVIHSTGTNDLRLMGGLYSKMKITAITMLIGAAALAGIPPFSGFYSKDAIIEASLEYGLVSYHFLPYLLGIITVLLTGIYIFRLWFMAFTGTCRLPEEQAAHVHESPAVMTVPLAILALFALLFGGVVNSWLAHNAFVDYVSSTFGTNVLSLDIGSLAAIGGHVLVHERAVSTAVALLPAALALLGLFIAWLIYGKRVVAPESIISHRNSLYRLLINRYYQGVVCDIISMDVIFGLARLARWLEGTLINGSIWLITVLGFFFGELLRRVQSGVVRNYAAVVALGTGLLILGLELWRWL
ncbi:MAG: Proton-translocating NADH-quinone oxidoreductase, chain L [Euryarchaeota archaeon 55_53]|nr:MAG: Proton-translocating NADH-quinone oxidoreductase, chain L [Euryarchaeota archaeon 55_53]